MEYCSVALYTSWRMRTPCRESHQPYYNIILDRILWILHELPLLVSSSARYGWKEEWVGPTGVKIKEKMNLEDNLSKKRFALPKFTRCDVDQQKWQCSNYRGRSANTLAGGEPWCRDFVVVDVRVSTFTVVAVVVADAVKAERVPQGDPYQACSLDGIISHLELNKQYLQGFTDCRKHASRNVLSWLQRKAFFCFVWDIIRPPLGCKLLQPTKQYRMHWLTRGGNVKYIWIKGIYHYLWMEWRWP